MNKGLSRLSTKLLFLAREAYLWFSQPIEEKRLYIAGGLCIFPFGTIILPHNAQFLLLTIGFALVVFAFICQAIEVVVGFLSNGSKVKNVLFSIFSTVFLTVPYFFANILASHKIQEITGIEASFFANSLTILTFLYFFYVTLIIAGGILVITGLLQSVYAFLIHLIDTLRQPITDFLEGMLLVSAWPRRKRKLQMRMFIGNVFAAIACFSTASLFEGETPIIDTFSQNVIAATDHYNHSICQNHPAKARLARLSDDKVLIAQHVVSFKWSFKIDACQTSTAIAEHPPS